MSGTKSAQGCRVMQELEVLRQAHAVKSGRNKLKDSTYLCLHYGR